MTSPLYLNKEYQHLIHNKGICKALQSPTKNPSFYTEAKGSKWINWPRLIPFDYNVLVERDTFLITHQGLHIHTLAFGSVMAGLGSFIRWDCVNGFTDIPDHVIW